MKKEKRLTLLRKYFKKSATDKSSDEPRVSPVIVRLITDLLELHEEGALSEISDEVSGSVIENLLGAYERLSAGRDDSEGLLVEDYDVLDTSGDRISDDRYVPEDEDDWLAEEHEPGATVQTTMQEDYENVLSDYDEVIYTIIEQSFGEGDIETGIENMISEDKDFVSSYVSSAFSTLSRALDSLDKHFPTDSFSGSSDKELASRIKYIETYREEVRGMYKNLSGLSGLGKTIENANDAISILRGYREGRSGGTVEEPAGDPGGETMIFGPDRQPGKPGRRKIRPLDDPAGKASKRNKKYLLTEEVAPSRVMNDHSNIDQEDLTTDWSVVSSQLSSFSEGFFTDVDSDILNGVEDRMTIEQKELLIRDNFEKFATNLSSEITLIRNRLIDTSIGFGGRISNEANISKAISSLNNLYASLWVWDQINKIRIKSMDIGYVNTIKISGTYSIIRHLKSVGRSTLRNFVESAIICSRTKLMFRKVRNDEGAYDEDLTARFMQEVVNQIINKMSAAIKDGSNKENIIKYIGTIPINQTLLRINAKNIIDVESGVVASKTVVNNKYTKCPVCSKQILWGLNGGGSDKEKIDRFKEKNLGNFKYVQYSFYRADGSLIDINDLIEPSSTLISDADADADADHGWKSKEYSGTKTWIEISNMIYSGDKSDHAEGLRRRSEVLAYFGGEPLNNGEEVRIRDSRFGCPYDSENDHCGLAVSEDGDEFMFGWNGSGRTVISGDKSKGPTRLDFYGKRDGDNYYTNSITEGNEQNANHMAKKYGNGGYKFSKHCFSCPCRITQDVAKDDGKFLYKYNYMAIPYFGVHSADNISNYELWKEKSPIGLPTAPDGSVDDTIGDNTVGYVICGASTSLSSFSRSGQLSISSLFQSIYEAEGSGDKPRGTAKRLSEWLISNGVDPFDIYEFVHTGKYHSVDLEIPPGEGEASDPIPAASLPEGFFSSPADRGYTDLYMSEQDPKPPALDEKGTVVRRRGGVDNKESALIRRSRRRKNNLKIINITSSLDINKSKRLHKISELLSTAMAKSIDSDIYDIIGGLSLSCPNGHKFSISQSINFANNNMARKIRGMTRIGEYSSEHNALMANGSFENYKKLGIIKEVSDFDNHQQYDKWTVSSSSKRDPSRLSFLGPDGRYYKISEVWNPGKGGFLATAWNTRSTARAPYSFTDPIVEFRMNYELSDKEYVKSKSTTKGEDDSGESSALEGEMVRSVEESVGGEETNVTDDARTIDEQLSEGYHLVQPIPHPSRLSANADTVRIQVKQLSISVESILNVIAQWRDNAVDSSFNMAFAYPENICCTEDDYRTIKTSIPEIIDIAVGPEDLEKTSLQVFEDLKSNLFDSYLDGVDLNRIHLMIPNYTYEYVSNMIYENISSSLKSVIGLEYNDEIRLDTKSEAFSDIVNILFPLKRFSPVSQKASYGKELVRKEFIGKLYMVASAIYLSRAMEKYANNYHNPASSNYVGYRLPLDLDANSAFNVSKEQISGFPSEVIRDLERGTDQLLDANGGIVGEIQYDVDESGAILNEDEILRKIKSAYHFSIKEDLENIDSIVFSRDVLDAAREYISNMAIDKIIEPISNTDSVLQYMDENGYVKIDDGSYSYEDRIRAISGILDQARAIEDKGVRSHKAGAKNKQLMSFLTEHGIDPVFYRNKTIFDAMTSSSQVATVSFRPYMDEWEGPSGQDYVQPYKPQIPSSLKIMFAYPTKETVAAQKDFFNKDTMTIRAFMRYPIISLPSHNSGFLVSQKRGTEVGHFVVSRLRPLGSRTAKIEGQELQDFISSKRLYEVDAYTEMLDNMGFNIWFVSQLEYPAKGVSSKTYSPLFGHLDSEGSPKKDLKANISSILDHPATEAGVDENGNDFYINSLFNYDSRLWQIGRVGKSSATGAVFSYPISEENLMRYDSPIGVILPFDLSPSSSNMGTNQERNLAKVFRNALPIADINFIVEIDNMPIDIGFLVQKTKGAFLKGLSDIDKSYNSYRAGVNKIKSNSSTSAEEKSQLEMDEAMKLNDRAAGTVNSISRLNYSVRTSESASKKRSAPAIPGSDPYVSAISKLDTPIWRSSIRPSIPLVDPQTAYRLVSGEQYSISGLVPELTSEEKNALYKFIVDVYGLNVIGKVFSPLMERGVGSTLSPEETLDLENVVKDYAENKLGFELTDDEYMGRKKVKGARDKGTPAERVQLILDKLNALRPNVVGIGKKTSLTVKNNNHLANVMGIDPGMYYNLSQESAISYVPVSVPVELFGQEWKKGWTPIDTKTVLQTRDVQRGYRVDEDGRKIPVRDSLLAGRISAATLDYFRGTQTGDVASIDQHGAEMSKVVPGTASGVEGIVGLATKMKRNLLLHMERRLKGLSIEKLSEKNDLLNKISYRRRRLFSIIKTNGHGADYKLK